jgi:hypothetical protein
MNLARPKASKQFSTASSLSEQRLCAFGLHGFQLVRVEVNRLREVAASGN